MTHHTLTLEIHRLRRLTKAGISAGENRAILAIQAQFEIALQLALIRRILWGIGAIIALASLLSKV